MKAVSRGIVLRDDYKKKPKTRATKDVAKPPGKYGENRVPITNVKTNAKTAVTGLATSKSRTNLLKRPAQNSPKDVQLQVKKQRSAFGDITNAIQVQQNKTKPKNQKIKNGTKLTKPIVSDLNKKNKVTSQVAKEDTIDINDLLIDQLEIEQKDIADDSLEILLSEDLCKVSNDSVAFTSSQGTSGLISSQDTNDITNSLTEDKDPISPIISVKKEETNQPPEGVRIVDTDPDPVNVTEYAESIFRNMRSRQILFPVRKYLTDNVDITSQMRAVLVDWLVEVQENFELYHETLYLAVKIVDLYLQKTKVKRDAIQLVGATAMLISCKIEERNPPPLDDFTFICDDAYTHDQFIKMEIGILVALDFELGIPIPYRFLRRYSRVAGASMQTLTLARYILELSLQEHEFVDCKASEISAACLNLAFKMMKVNEWDQTLVYHSGCGEHELIDLMRKLNKMLSEPQKKLTTIRMKYSHPVFHEVAKMSLLKDF